MTQEKLFTGKHMLAHVQMIRITTEQHWVIQLISYYTADFQQNTEVAFLMSSIPAFIGLDAPTNNCNSASTHVNEQIH